MSSSSTPDPELESGDQRGASLIEYALLVALIALVCLAAVAFFGAATSAKMSHNASALSSAGS